jgi:hypothetical protein
LNCFDYRTSAAAAKIVTQVFTSLHYNNVMLINNARCSWLDTPVPLQVVLSEAQSKVWTDLHRVYSRVFSQPLIEQELTLHAHGFGAAADISCKDLEFSKYSAYGLHPNSVMDAVTALVDLQQAGGLTNRFVVDLVL